MITLMSFLVAGGDYPDVFPGGWWRMDHPDYPDVFPGGWGSP